MKHVEQFRETISHIGRYVVQEASADDHVVLRLLYMFAKTSYFIVDQYQVYTVDKYSSHDDVQNHVEKVCIMLLCVSNIRRRQ